MNARVSNHGSVDMLIARLQAQAAGLGDVQDQVSSGFRVSRPSQGPAAYAEIRAGHEQAARFDAYQAGIADMTATLNQGVGALQDVQHALSRANAIAVEGANAATDTEAQAALANEVDGLIERLLNAANGRSGDRFLFAGTATDTKPFGVTARDAQGRPTAISYVGAEENGRGLVGPDQTVDAFYAGDRIFQQPGSDAFQALMGLRDELRDPNLDPAARSEALTQRIATIQKAQDAILGAIGDQASGLDVMQTLSTRIDDLRLAVRSRTSDLESVDVAEAIVRLREMDNMYQATLGLTSRLFQSSLVDFLR